MSRDPEAKEVSRLGSYYTGYLYTRFVCLCYLLNCHENDVCTAFPLTLSRSSRRHGRSAPPARTPGHRRPHVGYTLNHHPTGMWVHACTPNVLAGANAAVCSETYGWLNAFNLHETVTANSRINRTFHYSLVAD